MMTTSLWNCGVSTYGEERMNKWSTWSPFSIKHIPFDPNQCSYFPETTVGDSISEWTSVYREDYSRLGVTFNSPFDPHVLVRPLIEFLPPAPGPQPILLTSKAPGGHPRGAVVTACLLSSVPAPVYLLGWCPCPHAGLCGLIGTGASLHITVGPLFPLPPCPVEWGSTSSPDEANLLGWPHIALCLEALIQSTYISLNWGCLTLAEQARPR